MEDSYLYLTTPVFYPNAAPHLGHAFTAVIADCLKGYYSALGYKCLLAFGTDEHGEKIYQTSQEFGMTVEEFVEMNVGKFKDLWAALGIRYDKFVRTSDVNHKSLVKKIFEQFENTNQIFFDDWKGWYCNSCEENYSFRSIGKNYVCKLGHPLSLYNEKSYFLRVMTFKSWLLKEYKDKEDLIIPSHYKKEMENNFVNDLDDLSISREKTSWGIKVPGNSDHTIYVWFDALISYLTSLNYGRAGSNFQNYWESPNSKVIHIIGKEICRFHSIYWPIILRNLNIRMFDTLLVHGWLLMNDEKMSKSKKNVIDPTELLKIIPRDGLRLYLSKLNFFHDNQVNMKEIFSVYNSCLSNTFGNLLSRFYGIISKKFDYKIPDPSISDDTVEIDQMNIELDNFLNEEFKSFITSNNHFSLIDKIFDLFRSAGKLIEKNKAWSLKPEDPVLKNLMFLIYRLLCVGTWALSPVLIDSSPKIFEVLNISSRKIGLEYLKELDNFRKKEVNPLNFVMFPRLKYV